MNLYYLIHYCLYTFSNNLLQKPLWTQQVWFHLKFYPYTSYGTVLQARLKKTDTKEFIDVSMVDGVQYTDNYFF